MAASDGIDGVGRVRWGWFVNGHVYCSYCFVLCVVGTYRLCIYAITLVKLPTANSNSNSNLI